MTGPRDKRCVSTTKRLSRSQLAACAEEAVNKKNFSGSRFLTDHTSDYPKFEWNELILGRVLGKGGFETAYEVRGVVTTGSKENDPDFRSRSIRSFRFRKDGGSDQEDSEAEDSLPPSREFIAEHCLCHGGASRYAVKKLSKDLTPARLLQGTIDMAVEARLLSNISHPHIIKMRGIASTSPYAENFFIVLDRLYETLDKRLQEWETQHKRCSGLSGKLMDRHGCKSMALYEERIVAAHDLAAAIAYLHEQKIIYRDLKPENVGFNIDGDVKLFDFGLAKELQPAQMNSDGTYNLTELTGSPRYMSPEVANGQPYNESCDVYSFAILFWEIMALKRPFELHTPQSMRSRVYNGPHKRPPINEDTIIVASSSSCSLSHLSLIQICMQQSWDKDWHVRPRMAEIGTQLHKECIAVAAVAGQRTTTTTATTSYHHHHGNRKNHHHDNHHHFILPTASQPALKAKQQQQQHLENFDYHRQEKVEVVPDSETSECGEC